MIFEFIGFGFAGFMMIFAFLLSILSLAVVIYALYDIVFQQQELSDVEKIFWIVIILLFNLLGAIIYLLLRYTGDTGFTGQNNIGELERLADLRDREAITKEEYDKMREELVAKEEQKISGENSGRVLKYLLIVIGLFFLLGLVLVILGLGMFVLTEPIIVEGP